MDFNGLCLETEVLVDIFLFLLKTANCFTGKPPSAPAIQNYDCAPQECLLGLIPAKIYSSTTCFRQVWLLFCIYSQLYAFVSLFSFSLIHEYTVSFIDAIIVVDHKFLHLVQGPYIVFFLGDFICLVLFMRNSNYVLETVLLSFSFSFPRTLIVAYIAEMWLMIPPWVVAFMCCTLLVQTMLLN